MKKVIKKTILVSLSLLMTSCITPMNLFEGLLEDNPSTITSSLGKA